MQTLTMRVIPPHTCSTWAWEIAMSDCPYGCKIYLCQICHTKALVHNVTYGCKGKGSNA